ncbi:uncharacterized protein LOC100194193 [Zea mays]|uniref:Hydroxyproline-rich glycoprotein family protein n=1 Tax=Zea mays TaxID=4577 RepID=C0PDN5_MAIZE|nr:uncharacterized protein LOC100194193 [Zea mays]ACN33301.1 unknown [Zea mays]ONM39414.1 Hydroxyproline-rich glycoprotein family protein [Zea mays]|eukprot:NP_001266367.2 uncharacterized protein LOC100194193 [Zea mays]
MASPARPAATSVSGAFGLPPDARCSYDQPRRREGLQDERMVQTFVAAYAQPPPHQDGFYPKEAVMAAVEECMRKQADALLHSLDGIGGRLSQLELYCYKLERSIGELRSDVMDYHSESTTNFRCIDKNLGQVHKSLQVLQDRQDLAETPKELSKLQIAHEAPSHQKGEATGFPMLAPRENDHITQAPKHEVALLRLHQVNGMQSPAVQVQTSGGFVLQHLVPVSLSTQHDQQQLNQAPVYYVQSQDHAKSTESKALEPLVQGVQPLVHNPEVMAQVELPQKPNQATELYPQPQNHRLQMPTQQVDSHTWHPQQPMVQQHQYIIQQVSRHMAQQQSSSPHSQSAQATPLFPPFSSPKPASSNTDPITRSMAGQPPYSSSQQQHEVAHSFYGQGNTILVPVADHNAQHQQSQSVQLHSQGTCLPQPSKPSHCSVASYAVQGNGQTYSSTYKNPSNCPATVVALLPQPPATASMAYHPLGPQVVHNHPFGNMVETASVVGYSRDQGEILPVVTAVQPVMVDKLNAGSNVTSPREWSA